ncbi:tRNA (adenosine(37)-N6)-threonylcarbamoyltransferase complex ATPase subunit type 1 TsaE [Microcella alkalica]|uniref:tRNA (adenosine(37)-N6)-threonylcarbamoyltransferase complex ATPase subunit type 1 TsaE n=1 Tax=Microcella alkalica TaxID=355930 RepID=UPI002948C11D|nr:tRNA (adenosine(37)-N6)-threonylcarbamoyltransferase complex ATPase subunit type 1 TsaE [Microcella alkalica]
MTERLTVADPEAMAELGARVAAQLRAGDVIVLTGELGAGKTTFTRGLGAALGVRGTVTSPTFVLARTHPRDDGPPLVHVDAYRLSDSAELGDLDLDFEGSIVVVEWGAGLIEQLVDAWLSIVIERPTGAGASVTDSALAAPDPDDAPVEPRLVTLTGVGERWADLGWLHAARD